MLQRLPNTAVDTHVHLWDVDLPRFAWMRSRGGLIDRSWHPGDVQDMLRETGAGSAVLMQSANDLAETEYLLDVARSVDWVLGVSGWIPLDDPAETAAALERYAREGFLRSVRDLSHHNPELGRLRDPQTVASLRLLPEAGLVYDLADGWPVITDITEVARKIPDLTIVLDHLGQPPVGDSGNGFSTWARDLRRFAVNGNTMGKISGLSTCVVSGEFSATAARPVFEAALEAFGPDRLMYGSDWPINLRGSGNGALEDALMTLTSELGEAERGAILGGNARRVYGGAPSRGVAGGGAATMTDMSLHTELTVHDH